MTTTDPDDWILYEKDPATKIATLTLNRPDRLNAPTIAMRLRYADLLHQANIDDDVKVLVIRGEGDDFGTGQDLPEFMEAVRSDDGLLREFGLEDADVTYPPQPQLPPRRHRHPVVHRPPRRLPDAPGVQEDLHRRGQGLRATAGTSTKPATPTSSSRPTTPCSATPPSATPAPRPGCGGGRSRWASASSRRWSSPAGRSPPTRWPSCGFVNSVVPRDQLEAEVQKYALACAQNRPTDVIFIQKTFFEIMKQFQSEYMGSLSAPCSSRWPPTAGPTPARRDGDTNDAIDKGLTKAVKDFDSRFPPEWRLSKKGRAATEMS